ncbi:PTS sugar transporter subunit IIA [Azonexus sp.]|uniref:PTS sugar transporter subunit IIA n=1 Tax=Azonexus sp. TaxID=1872668 RepID=UPI0027B9CE1A|nr:PTS sugar transporter subunit IIA [Azonexus sp.]
MSTIAELLSKKDILLDLEVPSQIRLLQEVARHMEREHGMPQEWVYQSLLRREQLGSTALGGGVAIPHARIKYLERIQLAYLRLKQPIPYDAPDGKPVSDILVILVPKEATEEHLRILSEVTQMFSDPQFRQQLCLCTEAAETKKVFDACLLAA